MVSPPAVSEITMKTETKYSEPDTGQTQRLCPKARALVDGGTGAGREIKRHRDAKNTSLTEVSIR